LGSIELIMWALIGEMLASPVADYHPHAGAILGLVAVGTLLAGISVVGSTRVIRFAVFPATGIWVAARAIKR